MPFDFSAVQVPFRMQPGLRRLAPGALQLVPNRVGDRALLEKLDVLSHYAHQALLESPGFDAQPALRALCVQAATEHPLDFACDGASTWHARHLGWSLHGAAVRGDGPAQIGACLERLPPAWRLAALLSLAFAEDFAVIEADGRIPWLAVCLPSHWAPEAKIGKHFAQVHAPVADNDLLLAAADPLARLVTAPQRWERFVWTIARSARLGQHPLRPDTAEWPAQANAEGLAANAWFRTERQTFIPLPAQRQAVFTIHVETRPLADAVALPADARQLHDALASMSQPVLAYRGLDGARDRLLAWLSSRASATARSART